MVSLQSDGRILARKLLHAFSKVPSSCRVDDQALEEGNRQLSRQSLMQRVLDFERDVVDDALYIAVRESINFQSCTCRDCVPCMQRGSMHGRPP
jgi:hypothetical protein